MEALGSVRSRNSPYSRDRWSWICGHPHGAQVLQQQVLNYPESNEKRTRGAKHWTSVRGWRGPFTQASTHGTRKV